jgi:NAD(P)-dependent dehydrogenase (short-subunit alcohol dehydrogenase family)
MVERVTDKTIIVTGASRGLGAATALALGELGANVVLTARSVEALNEVAQKVESAGGEALVVQGDIGNLEDVRKVVERTLDCFNEIDALVNNAGVLEPIAPIVEADPKEWQRNLHINLIGLVWMTQAALLHLRAREGVVVHISSGAAVNAYEGWSAYSVAKAGVNHFSRSLAVEEPAVTSIAFRPGVVDTDMQALIRAEGAEGMPEDRYQRFVNYKEKGELLPPQVPARAIAALCVGAPKEWSGEYISIHEDRIVQLTGRFFPETQQAAAQL